MPNYISGLRSTEGPLGTRPGHLHLEILLLGQFLGLWNCKSYQACCRLRVGKDVTFRHQSKASEVTDSKHIFLKRNPQREPVITSVPQLMHLAPEPSPVLPMPVSLAAVDT